MVTLAAHGKSQKQYQPNGEGPLCFQAMMNLVWGLSLDPWLLMLWPEAQGKSYRLGPVVSLRENEETGEAHFPKQFASKLGTISDGKMINTDGYHPTFASIFIKQNAFHGKASTIIYDFFVQAETGTEQIIYLMFNV